MFLIEVKYIVRYCIISLLLHFVCFLLHIRIFHPHHPNMTKRVGNRCLPSSPAEKCAMQRGVEIFLCLVSVYGKENETSVLIKNKHAYLLCVD